MNSDIGPIVSVVLGLLVVSAILTRLMQSSFGTYLKGHAAWLLSQSATHPLAVAAAIVTLGVLLLFAMRRWVGQA